MDLLRLNKFQEEWYRGSVQFRSIQRSKDSFLVFGMVAAYFAAYVPLTWLNRETDPRLDPNVKWDGDEQWTRLVVVTAVGQVIGNAIPVLLLICAQRVRHLVQLMAQVIAEDPTASLVVKQTFEAVDLRVLIAGLPVNEVSVAMNFVLLGLPSVLFVCFGRW